MTSTTDYSTLAVADGDDITVNSGGDLTLDSSWAGADGSREITFITMGQRGIHRMDAGTTLFITDGGTITMTEGCQWYSNGTSGSTCTIDFQNIDNNTSVFKLNVGGKAYLKHTTIQGVWKILLNYKGILILDNATTSTRELGSPNYGGVIHAFNSTIDQPKSGIYCVYQLDYGLFVDCTFTSLTTGSAYLALVQFYSQYRFMGCTYNGSAIAVTDINSGAGDCDLEIYEKTTLTEGGSLDDVTLAPTHPSITSDGRLFDSAIGRYYDPYAFCESTAAGVADVYLLKYTGYYYSGTGAWTHKYWSDSGQAESGDNQKWTIMCAKSGYTVNTDTDWAGNAMSLTLAATGAPPTISSPALDDTTITQDQQLVITFEGSQSPTDGMAIIYSPGTTNIVYQGEASIDGSTLTVTVPPGSLPTGSYSAGDIKLIAANANGLDKDETLTMTVSAPSADYLIYIAESLVTLFKNDARLSDIDDDSIMIIPHEKQVGKITKYPAIAVVPISDRFEEYTCSLDKHTFTLYALPIASNTIVNRDDYEDFTEINAYMRDIAQIIREQDDDPDKRLSGVAEELHAYSKGVYPKPRGKHGRPSFVGMIEITVIVDTDEEGTAT